MADSLQATRPPRFTHPTKRQETRIVALKRNIPTAPQTRPDPRHETVYRPSQGGHYPTPPKPVPGTPKKA